MTNERIDVSKKGMIRDVAKSIVENRLVLFIGAGFAANINLPLWKNLLEDLLNSYTDKIGGGKHINEIKNLCNYGYLTVAFEKIAEYSNLPQNEIKNKVSYQFTIDDDKKNSIISNPLYNYLLELYKCGANKIVTTNYDKSIEFLLNIKSKNVLYPKNDLNNIDEIREAIIKENSEGYYLKLHGDIENSETMILFEEDYRKVYILDNRIPNLLQELFTHNRILFLGCGLNDRYMDIFEKLKIGNAVMKSYVICLEDESKWIAAKNGIIRIPLQDYKELSGLLEEILEETKRILQHLSKQILFSHIPLSTYDYKTASSFFDSVKKEDVSGCYFFNTQVEFSSWFTPSLQLHLAQQMSACCKRNNFDHYRILFLPYNKDEFLRKLDSKDIDVSSNAFCQEIKAMVKIHNFMCCKLAFLTSDVLKKIIKENNTFFIENKNELGLNNLNFNNLSNLDSVIKEQIKNGYNRKNDLDFSVIKKTDEQIEIWQANMIRRMFRYKTMDSKNHKIYEKFFKIIIQYIKDNEEDFLNPKNKELVLSDYLDD